MNLRFNFSKEVNYFCFISPYKNIGESSKFPIFLYYGSGAVIFFTKLQCAIDYK